MSLYKPPDWFVERLDRQSDGRFRIRWSIKKGEWHIEQKVGRGALPPFRIDEADDDLIRARDGFWFVLAVRPGNTMPCPKCGIKLKVPEFEFGEAKCEFCRLRGRDGRYAAAFFPLSEQLLEHLRKIDAYTGGLERQKDECDKANEALVTAQERKLANSVEDITKDRFTELFNIQSSGYTGKEFTG